MARLPVNPEVVLEQDYFFRGGKLMGHTHDLSSDGTRFLMIEASSPSDDAEPTQLILVQDELEELQRLVPVDR